MMIKLINIKALGIWFCCLFIMACSDGTTSETGAKKTSTKQHEQAKANSASQSQLKPKDLKNYVKSYCQNYIETVSKDFLNIPAPKVNIQSLTEGLFSKVMKHFENFFQPKDSKASYVFKCQFQIQGNNSKHEGSVDLLLVEDEKFAHYTQWKEIQVVDIGKASLEGGSTYYIVVKYLKIDGELMHLKEWPIAQ